MVRIRFNSEDEMGFQITGYQFPKINDKDYDGNWLNVYLEVNSRIGKWKTVDPSLLTWELEQLIEDLEKGIVEGREKAASVSFIEPNLEFVLGPSLSGSIHLKVIFRLESRPKTWSEDDECFLEGDFTSDSLKEIKNGLQIELKKYPKRI